MDKVIGFSFAALLDMSFFRCDISEDLLVTQKSFALGDVEYNFDFLAGLKFNLDDATESETHAEIENMIGNTVTLKETATDPNGEVPVNGEMAFQFAVDEIISMLMNNEDVTLKAEQISAHYQSVGASTHNNLVNEWSITLENIKRELQIAMMRS